MRREGGSAGGIEPSDGMRGRFPTVADWVNPLLGGGRGCQGGRVQEQGYVCRGINP